MKIRCLISRKSLQEFAETNASAPTVQLQSIRVVLAVMAYRKWDFRAIGVYRAWLTSGHLERDTYANLPEWVEKDDVAWELLNPLYGAITACKDWRGAIRDFLAEEFGWGVTSLGKSVFFWAQQGFGYGYWEKFRGPNLANLGKCILKANGNVETIDKMEVLGIVSLHVDGLLISGSIDFTDYISWEMEENPMMMISMEQIQKLI